LTLSETTFGTKIVGCEIGEYPKMWNLIFTHSFIAVFCRAHYVENVKSVIEDNNFKLDTQLGFVE